MSGQTTKMLAAMALGNPLHRIEHVCATQGAITSSRLIRMVDEAQDILKDYAYTINAEAGYERASDKARIAELERDVAARTEALAWQALTAATDVLDRRAAPHAWVSEAWSKGSKVITDARAALAQQEQKP